VGGRKIRETLGKDLMASSHDHSDEVEDAAALLQACSALLDSGNAEQAISCFGALVDRFRLAQDPALRKEVPRALIGKGASLLAADRLADAEAVLAEVRVSCEAVPDTVAALGSARLSIARLLVRRERKLFRERRHKEAIDVADYLLSGYDHDPPPENVELVVEAKMLRSAALAASGQVDAGISGLDSLVAEYEGPGGSAVRKVVANALYRKAGLLERAGDRADAIATYEEVLARFGGYGEEFGRVLADALLAELELLEREERLEDALRLLDELIRRFDVTPPHGRPLVAVNSRLRKLALLQTLERPMDALVVADEVVERYGDASAPDVRVRVAMALNDKAELLFYLDELNAALTTLNELARRFEHATEAELRSQLARGRCATAVVLTRLGQWERALAVDEEVVERYSDMHEPQVEELVATALSRRAAALQEHDRLDEAIDCWREVIERYGRADSPALRKLSGRALAEALELLWLTGRTGEMAELNEQTRNELPAGDEDSQLHSARAAAIHVAMLTEARRSEEAIEAADALARRFPEPTNPELKGQLAQTIANKVLALSELGRQQEAQSAQEDLLARFGEEALKAFAGHAQHAAHIEGAEAQHAASLYSMAWFLNGLDRTQEALTVIADLLQNYQVEDADAPLAKVITAAEALRAEIQSGRRPQ